MYRLVTVLLDDGHVLQYVDHTERSPETLLDEAITAYGVESVEISAPLRETEEVARTRNS